MGRKLSGRERGERWAGEEKRGMMEGKRSGWERNVGWMGRRVGGRREIKREGSGREKENMEILVERRGVSEEKRGEIGGEGMNGWRRTGRERKGKRWAERGVGGRKEEEKNKQEKTGGERNGKKGERVRGRGRG